MERNLGTFGAVREQAAPSFRPEDLVGRAENPGRDEKLMSPPAILLRQIQLLGPCEMTRHRLKFRFQNHCHSLSSVSGRDGFGRPPQGSHPGDALNLAAPPGHLLSTRPIVNNS